MTHKLIQKHLLHGTQEFELLDDVVKVKIKNPFKGNKELDVVLAILNPEPVVEGVRIYFHSRVKCGPLISLYRDKPSRKAVDAFVDALKEKAQKEYGTFAGLSN